jgi:DNA polymerase-3 subunit gamma/tau
LLDQLASTGQPITLELAHAVLGTATNQAVFDLVDALLAGEAALGLDGIHNTLDAGSDPRQFARQIVDYLRNLLLSQMGSADQLDATADARVQMALHAQALPASLLLEFIRIFNRAAVEGRATWQPSLPLEIAFIESLNLVAQPTPSEPPPVEPPEPAPPAVTARRRARYTPATDQAAPTEEGPAPLPESAPAEDAGDQEKTVEPADRQATQLLVQRWRQVLGLVRAQNPNTYGLLNSCKSRYLKGNILILGFASNVLKNQMLKKENLDIVSQALAQVLERPVAIRCEITAARRNSIPPDVEHDGMVAAALRDLGGEIVDVQ